MKRFGFGVLAAGLLAAATLLTTVPASARNGNGIIFFPPMMGSGMGGGMHAGPMGGNWAAGRGDWRGPGGGGNWGRYPGGMWHGPGGRNAGPNTYHDGQFYNGRWNGRWNPNWNRNWYRNGHWYGPRYRYRYPGYNWYYGGYWYPWPWWGNVWNFEIGDNYGYYGGGSASRHVNWCLNRYRSYNPRTDTYTGYDGRQHRCNGPY